ncbi:phospholipid carrier-dependent glycosyltransferase [Patescibacteria group bacterium]|nr:phospholipid carrier-dependent glycosyltransferase [Patescibacteria group bacterium]
MTPKHIFILVVILILAAFLRFYSLGELPNSYTPDEIAQGYTAYSIIQTGQDEWGSRNLLSLRSFGDFKPPLQTFFMIPSIKLFGLNTFSIRFPSAFFGTLSVFCLFALAYLIFKNSTIALISALLLAVSPWHVPVSRLALEANLSLFLIILAALLWLSKKFLNHIAAATVFILSLFSYHSAKFFTPIFVYFSTYFLRRYQRLFLIIFTFLLIVFGITALSSSATRAGDISIFNPTDKWRSLSSLQYDLNRNGLPLLINRSFNNKLTEVIGLFINNFLSYLSPQFLITSGPSETTYGMLPGFGVLGFAVTLCLLISLLKPNRKILWLLAGILLACIPAALSKGTYPANRLLIGLPFFLILASCGFYQLLSSKNVIFKVFIIILFIFETTNFFLNYFFHANEVLAEGMLFGNRQAVAYTLSFPNKKVVFSRKLSEPQAYVAFFSAFDPKIFQHFSASWLAYQSQGKSFVDQLGQYNLGRFTFKEISFAEDAKIPNTILIGRPEEFLGIKPDAVIYYPSASNQKAAIYIFNTHE